MRPAERHPASALDVDYRDLTPEPLELPKLEKSKYVRPPSRNRTSFRRFTVERMEGIALRAKQLELWVDVAGRADLNCRPLASQMESIPEFAVFARKLRFLSVRSGPRYIG